MRTSYLSTAALMLIGFFGGAASFASHALAQAPDVPKGYTVPDDTVSPDKVYGVTVGLVDMEETIKNPANQVIEMKTGKLLGAIKGTEVGFDNMNHDGILPVVWAADDSAFLWQIDGKWGFADQVLVKMENGKVAKSIEVLDLLQQEMLRRTRKATPKKYAAVKKGHSDWGNWYKDGFAVDCVPVLKDGEPLKFPIEYHCYLTSNTKGMADEIEVDSRMTAEISGDGSMKVTEFHMGATPAARNW